MKANPFCLEDDCFHLFGAQFWLILLSLAVRFSGGNS